MSIATAEPTREALLAGIRQALEAFVAQYEGHADREARPEMMLARAAIAKATHVPVTAAIARRIGKARRETK